MAKPWDESLRILVRCSPQAFVDMVVPGALYIGGRPEKLKNWQLGVDALLDVVMEDKAMLLHLEFQTHYDSDMPERLLRYNVLARSEYKLPILSCVIHLLRDSPIKPSPLHWMIPTGQEILQFAYVCIEIGDLSSEDIIRTGQPGLLPFLPLTKGGAQRDVVLRMFTELEANENKDLELVGFTLASLVFYRTNVLDHEWLQRRFRHMHEVLRDTPIFQEILREGLEQGHIAGLRQAVVSVIQARFPHLAQIANTSTADKNDINSLNQLIIQLSATQDEHEAEQLLLNTPNEGEH